MTNERAKKIIKILIKESVIELVTKQNAGCFVKRISKEAVVAINSRGT